MEIIEKHIQVNDLVVSKPIHTLEENFKNDIDNASSITDRLNTLKELHKYNDIYNNKNKAYWKELSKEIEYKE